MNRELRSENVGEEKDRRELLPALSEMKLLKRFHFPPAGPAVSNEQGRRKRGQHFLSWRKDSSERSLGGPMSPNRQHQHGGPRRVE